MEENFVPQSFERRMEEGDGPAEIWTQALTEARMWTRRDLNPRPQGCEPCDLPADLLARPLLN